MTEAAGALRQTLGPRAMLCGYPHPARRRWLARDELVAQAFSAGSLCVAGSLPVLCGHFAASDLALGALADAGWSLPERLLVFESPEELGALVREQAAGGARLAASFPLLEDLAPADVHLVPPSLRAFLNNKKNLERLVPEGAHPARRLAAAEELRARPELASGSVLKIATDEACGGGHDLLLPPDSGDAVQVRALLDGAEEAVLEECLPFRSTRCFNYLIGGPGEPRFLGAPEQFLSDRCGYLGNWFDAADRPDPQAVEAGAAICRRAAVLGYKGAAGLDAGFLADGSFKFFDLNFRMNGSTAPLLLFPDLQRRCGCPAALRTVMRGRASSRHLFAALRSLSGEARFLPMAVAVSVDASSEPEFLVSGFLPGRDKAAILASLEATSRRLGCG